MRMTLGLLCVVDGGCEGTRLRSLRRRNAHLNKNPMRLLAIALMLVPVPQLHAAFVQIVDPDAAYLSSTIKAPITAPDNEVFNTLTAGAFQLTLSSELTAGTVGNNWATWGSAPDAEESAPRVGMLFGSSSWTLTLSEAVGTFGVEVEPNNFSVFEFTLNFFQNATQIGSITRSVDGSAGSRLFAGSATGGQFITSVTMTSGDSSGFAAAQFRVAEVTQFRGGGGSTAVPEPASAVMNLVVGLGLYGAVARRRRRSAE